MQSDAHCDELEAQNNLLTEQIQDHQLQLSKKAAENEEAYSILSRKAPEWEVCTVCGIQDHVFNISLNSPCFSDR